MDPAVVKQIAQFQSKEETPIDCTRVKERLHRQNICRFM